MGLGPWPGPLGAGIEGDNQNITKTYGFLIMGLALAEDDRGARLAEAAANWWNDSGWPLQKKYWTGFAQVDSGYFKVRVHPYVQSICLALYNATSGSVNYLSGNWLKNSLMVYVYGHLPTATPYPQISGWGGGVTQMSVEKIFGLPLGIAAYADSNEAKYANYWLRNMWRYWNSTTLASMTNGYTWFYYPFIDPSMSDLDSKALPTQRAFITTDLGDLFPNYNTGHIISRTGWSSPQDTLLHIYAYDVDRFSYHLSSTSGPTNPGSYSIYKSHYLLADDLGHGIVVYDGAYNNWDQKSNYIEVGGTSNLKNPNGVNVRVDVETPRYSAGPNSEFMYALVDTLGAYTAKANLQRIQRQFIDFKGSGTQQFIVVYDDVEAAGQVKRTYLHYPNNGQSASGQSTEGFTALDSATKTITSTDPAGTRLLTQVLFPAGSTTGYVYTDSPDGSYPGGVGQTYRVSICASADGASCDPANAQAEFIVVHEPTSSGDGTLPTISLITDINPSFRGVEIDGSSPKIAILGRKERLTQAQRFVPITRGWHKS